MRKHIKKHKHANIWQLQEAKAKFSEVVENASNEGHQIVTKNGQPVVVIISKQEFDKMTQPKDSLLNFFQSAPYPEIDLKIERSKDLPRDIEL